MGKIPKSRTQIAIYFFLLGFQGCKVISSHQTSPNKSIQSEAVTLLSADTTGANKSFDRLTTANFYLFLISFLRSRHGLQQKVIWKSNLASAQSSNVFHSTLDSAVSMLEGPVLGLSGGLWSLLWFRFLAILVFSPVFGMGWDGWHGINLCLGSLVDAF